MLPPGAMPDAADLCRERVGEVVAVQVHRRDDVELVRPREHLLQRDVGDRVLDDDLAGALRRVLLGVGAFSPLSALVRSHCSQVYVLAPNSVRRARSPSSGRRLP